MRYSKSADTAAPDGSGGVSPANPRIGGLNAIDTVLEDLGQQRLWERRIRRWALAITFLFHGILLSITFPSPGTQLPQVHREQRVFVLEPTRFKQPPPPRGQAQPPERRKRKIPIPDPTPEDPEPIIDFNAALPEIAPPDLSDVIFGIPDAPAGGTGSALGSDEGPYRLGGNIRPPEKIYAPDPPYTEEARAARIQGMVLLQATIDEQGNVTDIRVLKDLPLGLTESALETVATWKFLPATREDEPVPVYFHFSVRFSLI